ncbi:hypothetical protein [Asaccharospora irregularis]|uniref:Uncharacterized protein n=1 Tax=Asaccharospora irregularis DSM 2635 TaxID=1121321 RepID=A0A1M5TF38_9FIRM|nr:hypothetical protein [Asaccharospora irregularis]SHH49298.1 hypothetical protein SAMN04488530_1591 [Asaccharospora irregularis DSM 2635]
MNINKENTLLDTKHLSNKYAPNDFIKTGTFIGYSPFCQDVIKHLNKELAEKRGIKYNICTRNGKDEQVTFTIESPKKRNLITIQPNRTLEYPRFYVSTSKSIIKALINMRSFEIQLSPIG